jgi:hypothetical protein
MRMHKGVLAGILGLLLAGLLLGTTWNGTYEAIPAGTDLASDLDIFINSLKTEVRQRLEVEHVFGGSTDDNGLHQVGSARCFMENNAPTNINSGTAALGQYNSAAGTDAGTALGTDEIGPTVRELGAGRCWIDLDGPDNVSGTPDDNSFAIWTGGAWNYVVKNIQGASKWGQNLLYNGSFEVTDGTGLIGSGAAPAGWIFVATNPTITYATPPLATEGMGVAITLTRGAGDGGIEQTLASLKSNTTFYVEARVVAGGGGTCELSTVNAGQTNLAAQVSALGTYQTLAGVFRTTLAAVDTLTVRLRVLTAGTCTIDSVSVVELSGSRVSVSPSGIVACWDTDTSTQDDWYTTAGTPADGQVLCEVTVPGPGYIIEVDGTLCADNESASANSLAVRLREEGVTVDLKTGFAQGDVDGANRFADIVCVPVKYVNRSPTPGTTLSYTLDGTPGNEGGAPSFDRNLGDDGADDLPDGANLATNLRVLMIPVR